ncbi:MAG: alpha amylase C-terminal domain-containing protein, partial [Clostridia bacterium]|nr:alpha amylase C-terminal domain-containing protein [Clostridia bacterium]
LNSDSECYGGSGATNPVPIKSEPVCHNQWYHSALITLPPFGATIFKVEEEIPEPEKEVEEETDVKIAEKKTAKK